MKDHIDIPDGVAVSIDGRTVVVRGKNGEERKSFDSLMFNKFVELSVSGSTFAARPLNQRKKVRAFSGSIMSHVANLIKGVTTGFEYRLKIHYTHFPTTVAVSKGVVEIKNFFGEKGSRKAKIIGSTRVVADKEHVIVSGTNIEDVSITASNIEQACRLSGKDRRIFQDGIYIVSKG